MKSTWILISFVSLIASRADAQVDYVRDVRPILEKHCYECHGAKTQKSGYRLDMRDIAVKGGDIGERAIVAQDAKSSPLIRYVSGEDETILMPPKESGNERLSAADVETLRTWINEGAAWPDEFSGISKDAKPHWSLTPLVMPAVTDHDLNPIDAFIREKLSEQSLALSSEADRRTLIRRMTFDLIGLPPTPDEIDAFVADASPGAFEAVIERLLASPQYGERWARHWLDVARYTESQGFEYDRLRDNAWHYRDYVIKSFNEDKPYDQFMKEQVAGDVLDPVTSDGIVAASLLVCGPWDQAGNAQKNATQRAISREDELEDIIGVVGQSFLGLTINCARCHAHKFDPIPHAEYYRIKSVFEGVKHGERSIATAAESEANSRRRQTIEQEITAAAERVSQIESVGAKLAVAKRSDRGSETGPAPFACWTFDGTAATVMPGELKGGAQVARGRLRLPKEGAFFRTAVLPKDIREKTLEAWVALDSLDQRGGAAISIENTDGSVFDAIVFGEQRPKTWMAGSNGLLRTHVPDVPAESTAMDSFIHVAIVYRADNSIALYRNGEPLGNPYTPASPLQSYAAGDAHVLLGLRHTGGGRPWLTGEIRQASLYDRALGDSEVAASFRSGGDSIPQAEILACLTPEQRESHALALTDLQRAKTSLDALGAASGPVSYAGVRVQPAPTRRLKRGDVNLPDEEVTPGALSAVADLDPDFGLPADAPEAQRRLKFAAWLADAKNPLPARVMANRVWHLHFGQGLVSTPNDFGVSGARPSHPELLDWLAVKFIDSGWSVKALHRLIMNSSTYRQTSAFHEPAMAIDADNQWLWRYTPRRLEAEAVRDAMLAVSGQINLQMGGPGFRPFTMTEFNAAFYTPMDRPEPEFNRRTVYRINVNSGKDPLLDSFDCPDPSVKTPRRGVTTTPLQALELMNNSFVQRQANHLAERAMKTAGNDVNAAIRMCYLLALGRVPTAGETDRAVMVINERGLTNVCWALLNSTEFIYVR